jgi:SAM-dependent MidA family methyltransferase
VEWLKQLPNSPFDGIIFANEVADALPVVRFVKQRGQVLPLGTAVSGKRFIASVGPADDELTRAVGQIETELGLTLPDGYRSEVCLLLKPWIKSLAAKLRRGGLLLLDYGCSRRDYYHAERRDGTLICHYRHRAHADPFFLPGLQDISAWVDFSACAEAGREAGLELSGFTTQAQFLTESMAVDVDSLQTPMSVEASSALKTLMLPGEMGENFKLLLMDQDLPIAALPGRDFRAWL